MFQRLLCRWFHRRHHREVERWEASWADGQEYRRLWCQRCQRMWTELVD